MKAMNIEELKEEFGDVPICKLTEQSIKELTVERIPVHVEHCILVPPPTFMCGNCDKIIRYDPNNPSCKCGGIFEEI